MIAATSWQPGQRFLLADICCCPTCGATDVFRRGSADGTAYWRCSCCSARWQEPLHAGLGKRCNAKALRLVGLHEAGQRRRPAEIRCCEDCGDTHVRRTSTVGRIGYWTCLTCGHGWTQVVEAVGAGIKVKRPAAPPMLRCGEERCQPVMPMAAAAS